MEYVIAGGFLLVIAVIIGLAADKGEDTYGNQK